VFDVLCSALTSPENKVLFQEEEGTELMCILLKSRGITPLRSIKVLNHAFSGPWGASNCSQFVKNQGLNVLFSIFMGKAKHDSQAEMTSQDEEHILEIIASLLNNLESDSIERVRLLAKFVEREYEKVDRLIEIRSLIQHRLKPIEDEIREQRRRGDVEEDVQLMSYLDRIESGLFSLQLTDYILAWLIMEDDGILRHIQMIFSRSDASLQDIIHTLQEYHENVGDDAIVSFGEEGEVQMSKEEGEKEGHREINGGDLSLKDVISNLVKYAQSLI
jgi:beta-catenin-like protein 1